jgi:hypothetical protein
LAILMPALNKVKKIAQRVVCGTNLKGLGTAQSVYANDYEDQFVKQGGLATSFDWALYTPAFDQPKKWASASNTLTVGASLYLLVREADVSPKSFVCGAGGQSAYDGKNSMGADLVELWDFGNPNVTTGTPAQACGKGPKEHVSYGYHQPYGRYSASGASSASFAIMADKNPWFDPKLKESNFAAATGDTFSGLITRIGGYWGEPTTGETERWQTQIANAFAHGREGQNVAFGDGHSEYCKTSDVGVKHDNIYTKQLVAAPPSEIPVRRGLVGIGVYVGPLAATIKAVETVANVQPYSAMDSLLVNDDDNLP